MFHIQLLAENKEKKNWTLCSTSPGFKLPARGVTLIAPSLGGLKENSLGAAAGAVPLVAKALGWLDESGPVSRLDRYSKAVEWSPIAVGPNLTMEWESSSGGRAPTARHGRWKSLHKQRFTSVKQVMTSAYNMFVSSPVGLGLAAELKSVLFGLVGAENQIYLQRLLWEQRSETGAWLHLDILHEIQSLTVDSLLSPFNHFSMKNWW